MEVMVGVAVVALVVLVIVALLVRYVYLQGSLTRKVLRMVMPKGVKISNEKENSNKKGPHLLSSKPRIALTIDDVPGKSMEALLDELDVYGVKATLFVISGMVNEVNEKRLVRALRDKHELANHMMRDCPCWKLSAEELESQFVDCEEVLKRIEEKAIEEDEKDFADRDESEGLRALLKSRKRWFRPGSGWIKRDQAKWVRERGKAEIVLGSVYPFDAQSSFSSLNALQVRLSVHPGAVIVLHDRPHCLATLRSLLPFLTAHYSLVTVSDLFAH